MKIAQRMNRLGTETAFDVLTEVNALRSQGRDIISLAIGEPACDTADYIKQAAKDALDLNMTHYGPSQGLPAFREVIAKHVAETRNISVSPEEIVVVPGGKPVIFFSILACIEEGDEVVYPLPGYPIYESMIRFAGGIAVPLRLREEHGFSFDVRELRKSVTDRTRMIIVNSPQNPTGGIIPKSDLHEISELALHHDLWVLSDEIYRRITYETPAESVSQFPGMKERTIILDGHSKTYAMTGWRVGYGVMPRALAMHVTRLMTNSNSCTATFTQHAAMVAMTGPQESVTRMVADFRRRRDLIVDGLNGIEGFSCRKPMGAFYAYPNVTNACRTLGLKDSRMLQQYLLQEAGVAVLGQQCFGTRLPEDNQEYIRFSYVSSDEDIREALRRVKNSLSDSAHVSSFLARQPQAVA
ncbi:MAG: aspartate aminotransferase [Ignavibacteria bacterium GWA2_55_11]|nr:MAG: aspartate aminotransferase [Ignavibacteria bacterium GWA2_55_11]OGU69057.1 MAG: aspartate aminotransferase [Ignavibacteria bacterium RIFCSPLOWO2_02_FULL_55_14]